MNFSTDALQAVSNGTGPTRSRIVLGGRFGEEPAAVSHQRIDRFVELGGTIIETGHSYADGRAEQVLGDWLASSDHRATVAVVDKFCHPYADGVSRVRPSVLHQEITTSLRRLRTSYLDLALLHRDDPNIEVQRLIDALETEVSRGRIRAYGVANWQPARLATFLDLAHAAGTVPIGSYQYSLAMPRRPIWPDTFHASDEIRECLQRRRAWLLAWAAQARGWFASESTGDNAFDTPSNRLVKKRCQQRAKTLGCAPATVALAWTLHQPRVLTTVGPQTHAELVASMAAADIALTTDDLDFLAGNGVGRTGRSEEHDAPA